jgi:DNA-binding NarL/FixJ family response regulator
LADAVARVDVVALVDDIFFQAKMKETAKLVGIALEAQGSAKGFLEAVEKGKPQVVIIDLNARDKPLEALRSLRTLPAMQASDAASNPARIIAYLSHVQTELAAEAKAAGCEDVMPRSKFTQNLAAILSGAKA